MVCTRVTASVTGLSALPARFLDSPYSFTICVVTKLFAVAAPQKIVGHRKYCTFASHAVKLPSVPAGGDNSMFGAGSPGDSIDP